jgi:hypothetical protein
MRNEANNGDVADPLNWLQVYFNPDIVEDAGYSVHTETEYDDAGITEMQVIIKRLE